jgi:hypothetical protein
VDHQAQQLLDLGLKAERLSWPVGRSHEFPAALRPSQDRASLGIVMK